MSTCFFAIGGLEALCRNVVASTVLAFAYRAIEQVVDQQGDGPIALAYRVFSPKCRYNSAFVRSLCSYLGTGDQITIFFDASLWGRDGRFHLPFCASQGFFPITFGIWAA